MWDNYKDKSREFLFLAKCLKRNETRTFRIDRIDKIKRFNCKLMSTVAVDYINMGLWYSILNNDLLFFENIWMSVPESIKSSDLCSIGNYAHYLALKGDTQKALNIYRKYQGINITDEYTWKGLIQNDFDELESIQQYKSIIQYARNELNW